jgi:hypothetical protein
MSGTTLTTIIIVLSEIVLALLALAAFLYLRSRKQKSTKTNNDVSTDVSTAITAQEETKEPSLLSYIEAEISRTSARLEGSDSSQDPAEQERLTARLNLLSAEKQVLDELTENDETADYWAIINKYYKHDVETDTDTENGTDKRDAIYLTRIKNLEKFKLMFIDSQDKLKESFDTINDLKHALGNLASKDEAAQLEEMVDKLSIDNISSNKKLNDANQQLQSVLKEMEDIRSADDIPEQPETSITESTTLSPLDYIETEIHRTSSRLQEMDASQDISEQESLTARLNLLGAEKELLEALPDDSESVDYWNTIKRCYKNEDSDNNEQDSTDKRDAIYLARIQNLENFKSMFIDSQDQLKDSFDTIDNLKNALGNLASTEEAAQLGDMVDKLSIDNINLNKQLLDAQQQLQTMLEEIQGLHDKQDTAEITAQAAIADLADNQLSEEMVDELSVENMKLSKQLGEANDKIQAMLVGESQQTENNMEATASGADIDHMSGQIELLKEENEFLTTQIEYLLQQETESSDLMKAQMERMETALSEKETEAANDEQSTTTQNQESPEPDSKLLVLEEENEFLTTQIEYLLQQEVENTRQMKERIEQLETTLQEKETEHNELMQSDKAHDENTAELDTKLHAIEEENEFLCSQIQHLLQQELDSSDKMKTQMEQLETALKEKQVECETLKETASD